MKQTVLLLFLGGALCVNFTSAQKQVLCKDGAKMTIDEKTTFVFDAAKNTWNSILNGKAVNLPKPIYPPKAKEKKLRGAVGVQVEIDQEGKVVSASAVSGFDLLRPAAIEAARRARFKKLLIDCQPRAYQGIIIYNFTGNDEESGNRENSLNSATPENKGKLISIGDVTKKAVYLPQPRVPYVDFAPNALVTVEVLIDAASGKVLAAKSVFGARNLRRYAEEAASCARFAKTGDVGVKSVGYLRYKFDASSKSTIGELNGGVLNGKAISLPAPVLPPDVVGSSVVSVRVELDEEGNVTSAKAVSGNPCLGESAVEAARRAKFTKTLLSGVPVRISGIVVYNFPAKEKN